MAENRRLKTLVQEGKATPEEAARLDEVRARLFAEPTEEVAPKAAEFEAVTATAIPF